MVLNEKQDTFSYLVVLERTILFRCKERRMKMRLNVKALTLTAGILWALALFLTGLANLIWSGYGESFLNVMASLYPGYHANGLFGDLVVGTLYAFVDGIICGWLFGWLYNRIVGKKNS